MSVGTYVSCQHNVNGYMFNGCNTACMSGLSDIEPLSHIDKCLCDNCSVHMCVRVCACVCVVCICVCLCLCVFVFPILKRYWIFSHTVASLYHHFTKVAVNHKALCAINVLRLAIDKYRETPTKLTSLHADLAQVIAEPWMDRVTWCSHPILNNLFVLLLLC